MAKADGFEMLRGHVELDEAYVGGYRPGKRGRGAAGKTIVMGLKERGGRMTTEVIPNVQMSTLRHVTLKNVLPGSTVSTDELFSYGLLEYNGYEHGTVNHSSKEYVRGPHHVNNVELFRRVFKPSIRSTHIHVSSRHMNKYLDEFTFRSQPSSDVERDV